MVISNILFPKLEITDEFELYFKGDYLFKDNQVIIQKDDEVSFCSYFNSFTARKWEKYTSIESLKLELDIKGDFEISFFDTFESKGEIRTTPLYSERLKVSARKTVSLPIEFQGKNIIYFTIKAKTDTVLYGGSYVAEVEKEKINNVKLAIGICTFKREEFVVENLRRLAETIQDPNSPLYNKAEVFVSDNASTLEESKHDFIHIYKNPNYGGAGGFTRTLIEALYTKEEKNFTHFIFMDDDITLDPRAIEKNFLLLSVLKPEYLDSAIGGAMCSMTNKYLQFENAAKWAGWGFRFNLRDVDLRRKENLVLNEKEWDVNYNAWCYCCYPFSVLKFNNLPIPIFFHMDDIEFCLRNKMHIITLNGINVWHLYSRAMPPAKNQYYDIRNKLIMLAELNPSNLLRYAHIWMNFALMEAFAYHYGYALNTYQALIDFCKGIDFLKVTNTLKLHNSLTNDGKWRQAEQFDRDAARISKNEPQDDNGYKKYLFKQALKKKQDTPIVIYCRNKACDVVGHKKVTVYDPYGDRCIDHTFSIKKLLKVLVMRFKAQRAIKKRFNDAVNSYHKYINQVQNIDYWNKYLSLNREIKKGLNVCFCSSDNNISSGAFNSMVVLASKLRSNFGIKPLILLPSDGNGFNLLREYDLPYLIVDSEDWIVKESASKEDILKKTQLFTEKKNKSYEIFKRIFKEYNIDLVHVNTSYHFAAVEPALDLGIKVVWHVREFLEEDQARMFANKEYSVGLLKKADAVIAISDSIREKYSYLPNVTKVFNGIDTKKYLLENHKILEEENIKFLCVGVVDEYKGQQYLVDALINLSQNGFNNFNVTLVGMDTGGFASDLKIKIAKAGLKDKFHFLGIRSDAYKYYADADVIFVGSKAEAFGRITVEGMMAGCLVVGLNSCGTKEIIDEKTGLLFENDRPEEVEKIILSIEKERKHYREIAKNGQQKACELFSADTNAANVYEVYKKVMGL